MNIVELAADPEEQSQKQPCVHGNLVEGHAVYCHNRLWRDAPRKCRRTWYTGGEVKDEDCPGFDPNPNYPGALNPTPIDGELCSVCAGSRRQTFKHGNVGSIETCRHCEGDGIEPHAQKLSEFAQNTLELGCQMTGRPPDGTYWYVRFSMNEKERNDIYSMADDNLLDVRSMTFHPKDPRCAAWLLCLTGKGLAVLKANWEAAKKS